MGQCTAFSFAMHCSDVQCTAFSFSMHCSDVQSLLGKRHSVAHPLCLSVAHGGCATELSPQKCEFCGAPPGAPQKSQHSVAHPGPCATETSLVAHPQGVRHRISCATKKRACATEYLYRYSQFAAARCTNTAILQEYRYITVFIQI